MIRLDIFGATVAVALLATSAAQAQGETMKELLGSIGVIDKQGPAIEYRERAPLVLPPRGAATTLPEPAARGRARNANGQWPNDRDVAARRAEEAEARVPTTETYLYRMNSPDNRMTPEEMRAGRTNRPSDAGPVTNGPSADAFENMSRPVGPGELRRTTTSEDNGAVGDEPSRRTLTQPPLGYRKTVSGKPVKVDFEAPTSTVDESDPRAFQEEQRKRR